jgi:hypothetical protein
MAAEDNELVYSRSLEIFEKYKEQYIQKKMD